MTDLEVGFADSLAWRADGEVRVALHLPEVVATSAEIRFRDGDRRVRRPGTISPSASASGSLVEVALPARRLADGLWRVAVSLDDAQTFTRVEARLLVRPGQPVALLPGPEPETRLPEPAPRPVSVPAPARARAFARRVAGGVRRRLPGHHS